MEQNKTHKNIFSVSHEAILSQQALKLFKVVRGLHYVGQARVANYMFDFLKNIQGRMSDASPEP